MRNFTVSIGWDGQTISGVSVIGPLHTSTEVISIHEGGTGSTVHVPGRSDTDTLTLSRSVGDDLTLDLWARGPLLRKLVELTLVDTSDGLTVTYRIADCWVCGYAVAPDVATGSVVESLTLSTGRWQRVTPPAAEVAERLAGERASRVSRIDVAALLSRLRSETTANLDTVLAEAREAGAVLLLDEADALFARRTDVQDAHDRYADAAVGALLQRLSAHDGPVVVEAPGPRGDPTRPPDRADG